MLHPPPPKRKNTLDLRRSTAPEDEERRRSACPVTKPLMSGPPNSKHETLNPKQIQISNGRNPKHGPQALPLWASGCGHSDLFWIRIWTERTRSV